MLTFMTVLTLVTTGMGVALLGTIKLELAENLQINEKRVGGLISTFGFITIPVILASGFLTDSLGPRIVLSGGALFMLASLFILATSKKYFQAMLAILLFGAGWAAMTNVVNVLTPIAFKTDSIGEATNFANLFFGLGAFLTPLCLSKVLKKMGLKKALFMLLLLVAFPVILPWLIDIAQFAGEKASEATPETTNGISQLLKNPMMWICAASLFFYGPVEASFSAWSTTMLEDKGMKEDRALSFLSGFWLCYMLSRLIAALVLTNSFKALAKSMNIGLSGENLIFITFALLLAVGTLLFQKSRNQMHGGGLLLLCGFLIGPVFPVIMAILLDTFESSLHGRAVGIFFGIGNLGWTFLPMFIGAKAEKHGISTGFKYVFFAAAGMCIAAIAASIT